MNTHLELKELEQHLSIAKADTLAYSIVYLNCGHNVLDCILFTQLIN